MFSNHAQLTIESGTITATAPIIDNYWGTGIECYGGDGNIVIKGGSVTAVAIPSVETSIARGAGIDGGLITVTGGTIFARGDNSAILLQTKFESEFILTCSLDYVNGSESVQETYGPTKDYNYYYKWVQITPAPVTTTE